jgi:signal transduction histidine kinase
MMIRPMNRWRSNRPALVVCCFLLLCFSFQSIAAAQVKPVKRVLIFNELGLWSPGVNIIDQQIFTTLRNSPYQIEFYEENLDTNLFPDEGSQHEFQEWYFRKYRDRKLDLIIAVGPAPLALRSRDLWIAAALIILGLLALFIYLHYSRRQLIQARDAQRRLSGLLINAQEQERQRLASELHDDFSQRLALLAFGLENASEEIPDSLPLAKQKLRELWDSVSELGIDLHTVSHRLHSSTLESLGFVPGVTALCKEFSVHQSVEVALSTDGIVGPIPSDVSLCLYRVVQEGLQNIKKHSGATRADVKLSRVENNLELTLRDYGCGFDLGAKNNRMGIGIQSMRERVRQLDGEFKISSEPGKGTSIQATVPLRPGTAPGR